MGEEELDVLVVVIAADGRAAVRTDPMWFTDYMRRATVEWGRAAAEAAE